LTPAAPGRLGFISPAAFFTDSNPSLATDGWVWPLEPTVAGEHRPPFGTTPATERCLNDEEGAVNKLQSPAVWSSVVQGAGIAQGLVCRYPPAKVATLHDNYFGSA